MNMLNSPELNSKPDIVLGLLNAVHANNAITQRGIAQKMGIALGLANGYLRRCITKGYIKVNQAPTSRYAYYLTPKGFAEKSILTAKYLSQSLQLFQVARAQSETLLNAVREQGWQRVALVGVGDLSEIMLLCERGRGPLVVGIYDPNAEVDVQCGMPVVRELAKLQPLDGVIIADLSHPQRTFEHLAKVFPDNRILALPLLCVVRNAATGETED